jgi:hypothetical protein
VKLKIFKSPDQNIDNILETGQALVLLGVLLLAVVGVSAICYGIWESFIGAWGFHISRDVFPVVGAIILCAIQLYDQKK